MIPPLILLTAPSGAGKTTIARRVLQALPGLHFSVSATTRPPREGEADGVHYHFVSEARFREMIREGALLEYEEVYPGRFYGTPMSEIECDATGVLLDLDVKGALRIKERYGRAALALFIAPPSVPMLEARLRARGTETEETLKVRLDRARFEMDFAQRYDHIVVNDDLDAAVEETLHHVRSFLSA